MNDFNEDLYFSRFFLNNDPSTNELIFNIPSQWWSRLYEYKWASNFANPNDVCLDAACGLEHHLKYYLASMCKEVHACDIDESITNKDAIGYKIRTTFGDYAFTRVKPLFNKLNLTIANISNLPYEDKKFDKIYCISVLGSVDSGILEKSFLELNRVLKDDGLIIITFDHPTYEPTALQALVEKTGLEFACGIDVNKPTAALQSQIYSGLSCFRAVLTKSSDGIVESANIIE